MTIHVSRHWYVLPVVPGAEDGAGGQGQALPLQGFDKAASRHWYAFA